MTNMRNSLKQQERFGLNLSTPQVNRDLILKLNIIFNKFKICYP